VAHDEQPEPGAPPALRTTAEDWRRPWLFPYESLGAIALVLGGVAMACAPLPGFQAIASTLGGLSFAIGIAGWIAAGKPDRGGRVIPAIALSLGLAVLLVATFWPNLLGGGPPLGDNTPRPFGRNVTVSADEVQPPNTEMNKGAISFARMAGVRIEAVAAVVAPIKYASSGTAAGVADRALQIQLRVFNGSSDRPLKYHGWSYPMPGDNAPSTALQDNRGKAYALRSFPSGREVLGQVRETTIPPSGMVEDVLIFEVPDAGVSTYRLELPLAAIGGTGKTRLDIPGTAVVVR
jgi:hypothetical protein